MGRIPKGRKVFFCLVLGFFGFFFVFLWGVAVAFGCRAWDFNVSEHERPRWHCSRSPGGALASLRQAVLKIGCEHHSSATIQSVARHGAGTRAPLAVSCLFPPARRLLTTPDRPERGMVFLPGENKGCSLGVRGERTGLQRRSDSPQSSRPLLPQNSAPAAYVGKAIGKGCERR